MMEVVISAVVRHRAREIKEVDNLLSAFQEMVNYAIKKGLKKGYSLKKLHAECYQAFKSKYDFHTHIYPQAYSCLLYTSPSPRDRTRDRMPSSA